LGKHIGHEPGNCLIHNFSLIINPLDGQKDFAESPRMHDIKLPFCRETSTIFDELWWKARVGWKGRK
jgi:hypothetical protein